MTLTDFKVRNERRPGRHKDGNGLFLAVQTRKDGGLSKSWVLLLKKRVGDKWEQVPMGLGPYPEISLKRARERAEIARPVLRTRGADAARLAFRREESGDGVPTFGELAKQVLRLRSAKWTNAVHRRAWEECLTGEKVKKLTDKPINLCSPDDVTAAIAPTWEAKPVTGRHLLYRVNAVFKLARLRGLITDNPADPEIQLGLLGDQNHKVKSHRMLPFDQLPDLMMELRASESRSAAALAFTILTAARSGEVRLAKWDELDLTTSTWTIPTERVKHRKAPHRVALSRQAIAILKSRPPAAQYVFAGLNPNRPLNHMGMDDTLKRLRPGTTVHAMRASFRTWVARTRTTDGELAEAALAHLPSKVVRAYLRDDLLEERRALMQAWADYVLPPSAPAEQVIGEIEADGLTPPS